MTFTKQTFVVLAAALTALTTAALSTPAARAADTPTPAAPLDYRKCAEEITDSIQAHFFDPKTNRYRPTSPLDLKHLPYDFMWGSGVELSALVGATRAEPAKYRPWLDAFENGLEAYWDPEAPVPGYNAYCSGPHGSDKYYDDNEWIVLADLDAYDATHDPKFLRLADRTQKFALSGWDDALGGGIYWKLKHETKNTCSNAPAATSALLFAKLAGDREQKAWGARIHDWVDAHLKDPADDLYWDNINPQTGRIGKAEWSYNTALMIRADVLLYQLNGDKAALDEARKSADAGIARWTDPATGSLHKTEPQPIFTHLFCESLLRLYDVTHEPRYLDTVKREAAFSYQYGRDPSDGLYWERWTTDKPHPADERKHLIGCASAARLFWLLVPYQDK